LVCLFRVSCGWISRDLGEKKRRGDALEKVLGGLEGEWFGELGNLRRTICSELLDERSL